MWVLRMHGTIHYTLYMPSWCAQGQIYLIVYTVCAWHSVFRISLICSLAVGNLCMITGGRNLGRVGTVVNRERHPGSFDIVHVKDSQGHTFATR